MLSSTRLPAAVAALLLIAAVPAFAAGPQIVSAELWNKPDGSQGITLSTDHVKPGVVQFRVKNVSSDEDHEMLLVKANSPDDLPMDSSGAYADEDKLKGLKELGDLHPGKSKTTTVQLLAGKYLLFCNEAGHLKAGMFATFTVAP